MTRPTIRAIIEDGPRAGETHDVDAEQEDTPPKEFLLPDEHLGERPATGPVPSPSGAVSTYRLVGPAEQGDGYVYRVTRHGG